MHHILFVGSLLYVQKKNHVDEVSYYLIPMAKKANVPVVVHLDHGLNKQTCIKALELGFTSIMYDCSTDPYEVNVEKVKEILKKEMFVKNVALNLQKVK